MRQTWTNIYVIRAAIDDVSPRASTEIMPEKRMLTTPRKHSYNVLNHSRKIVKILTTDDYRNPWSKSAMMNSSENWWKQTIMRHRIEDSTLWEQNSDANCSQSSDSAQWEQNWQPTSKRCCLSRRKREITMTASIDDKNDGDLHCYRKRIRSAEHLVWYKSNHDCAHTHIDE